MYISNVRITNYRGIKSDKFESSPFTCAIGENNSGKSTLLLAISLFFSGTSLSSHDFYDVDENIEIVLTFSSIEDGDILRLSTEHRERIKELISDGDITLTRLYDITGKSELLCTRMSSKDPKLTREFISPLLRGQKGKAIGNTVKEILPKYSQRFLGVDKQSQVFEILEEIVSKLPADELESRLSSLPTGIENSIKYFLPEPIYIAAVKDFKDDVKSKETATFGKLLGILLKFLEDSDHFTEISKSFNTLYSLLNVTVDQGNILDGRIEKLRTIENQITSFLKANFPKSHIQIEIPRPELKQILSNAQIFIDDGVKGMIDTKGDGIKRAVTFALLRTYVQQLKINKELQNEKKNKIEKNIGLSGDENIVKEIIIDQPYVFLFEEPELFLHPSAQRILFEALENLTEVNNQVFVTTHSPLFFSPRSTGTFIKVVKEYPEKGKPFGKLLTVNLLKEIQTKDAFQIICYENNSAAFFANKILLVEGDSDLIYVKEVAKLLKSEWDFDTMNIPIISINGKSNVKRFVDFYGYFNIKTFTLVDSDALIDGFEKFDVGENIVLKRSQLLAVIDKKAIELKIEGTVNARKVKELVRRYSWIEKYQRLKSLANKIRMGEEISEDEILEIDYLFSEEILNSRRQIFTDRKIKLDEKTELLKLLREQNIFVLSYGAIESYYPAGIIGADKPTKALNAIKFLKEADDCRSHLPTIMIDEKEQCELEIFFEMIFT